jgi:hypothetical protein
VPFERLILIPRDPIDDPFGDTIRIGAQVAFPNSKRCPALFLQEPVHATVSLDVRFDFRNPISRVMSIRQLREASLQVSTMPEIPVAKNGEPG